MATALQAIRDAPVEITRASVTFCRREFEDVVKRAECISVFSESTSPEELRRKLACVAGSESTRETQECVAALSNRPYRDGTTILDTIVGSDAAEYAREVVAAAEPILLRWERPEIAPTPPPPIAPAPTVVEAARRGRGRPRGPSVVPLRDQVATCMPQLPADLRGRLEAGLPDLLEDIADRLFTSEISRKREFCHQVRDALRVEPGLAPLEACVCGADRRLRVPSVLEIVQGRSAIVQFEWNSSE